MVIYGNKNEYPLLWKKNCFGQQQKAFYLFRVTINADRFEVSTERCVEPPKWSTSAGKVKGNSEEARSINQYLDSLKQKVYDYQKSITQEGKNFTKEMLRAKWYGIEQHAHTLLQVFREQNDQLRSLIGKDNSKATYTKYRTTLDHTISFLQWKFKRSDLEISSINYSFITDFEFSLKSVRV